MGKVVHFDKDGAEHRSVSSMQISSPDIGACLADRFHDVGVQASTIFPGNGKPYRECFSGRFLPVDVYPALIGREGEQVGTVRAVNRDASTLGDVTDH